LNPADHRRSRLVNYRWLLIAAEVLPNRHEVEFITQRELRCFVYLSKYCIQPPFLTNFILDLSLADLDSLRLFAIQYGGHVRSYTLSFTERHSVHCSAKVATLIQHSVNIVCLTVRPNEFVKYLLNQEQPVPMVGAELPVFTHLRWIFWSDALYDHQLVIQILRCAPSLQVLSCSGVLRVGDGWSRKIYPVNLAHLLPHLPSQAQADIDLVLNNRLSEQIPIIHRITASRNTIRSLSLSSYEGEMSLEWSKPLTALLSSQADSLRALKIYGDIHQIPALRNLETLRLDGRQNISSILSPREFRQLKALELAGAQLLRLFALPIWPSIKSMHVTQCDETVDDLPVVKLWEVFPNLFTADLSLRTSSQRKVLSFFMQNVRHVVELRLSFSSEVTTDLWEELTGSASRASVNELLSEDFSHPDEPECSRPNSFAGFTSKFDLTLTLQCSITK